MVVLVISFSNNKLAIRELFSPLLLPIIEQNDNFGNKILGTKSHDVVFLLATTLHVSSPASLPSYDQALEKSFLQKFSVPLCDGTDCN